MTAESEQVRDHQRQASPKVSKLVVGTLTYFTGRGPESTATRFGDDFVVVVVRGCLTRPERQLVDAGHADTIRNLREKLNELMAPTLIDGVADITGRTVDTLLSSNQLDPDVAVHTFLLGADSATA